MLLLLSPLSWLSWPTAKAVWLSCNLVFALAIPWLTIRLLPRGSRLGKAAIATVCLLFYGFYSTRVAIEMGQTTLIALLSMLASILLADRRWFASGVWLGVALSKYSLSLPALALLAGARRSRVVLTALAMQALGTVAVSLLKSGSLAETVQFYRDVLRRHAVQSGMHLSAQLPRGAASTIAVGILICAVLIVLGIAVWRSGWWRTRIDLRAPLALHIFNVVGLLTLLAIYHRGYDAAFVVVSVALVVWERESLGAWFGGRGLAAQLGSAAVVLALTLPTPLLRVIFAVVAPTRDPIASAESLISLAVTALLAAAVIRLYRATQHASLSMAADA
jgi:hypothetical protein